MTPACAGTTPVKSPRLTLAPDDPRVCGDDRFGPAKSSAGIG